MRWQPKRGAKARQAKQYTASPNRTGWNLITLLYQMGPGALSSHQTHTPTTSHQSKREIARRSLTYSPHSNKHWELPQHKVKWPI